MKQLVSFDFQRFSKGFYKPRTGSPMRFWIAEWGDSLPTPPLLFPPIHQVPNELALLVSIGVGLQEAPEDHTARFGQSKDQFDFPTQREAAYSK